MRGPGSSAPGHPSARRVCPGSWHTPDGTAAQGAGQAQRCGAAPAPDSRQTDGAALRPQHVIGLAGARQAAAGSLHLIQRVNKVAVQQDLVGRAEAKADAVEAQRPPSVLVLLAPHGCCARQGATRSGRMMRTGQRDCWKQAAQQVGTTGGGSGGGGGGNAGAQAFGACMHSANYPSAANSPVERSGTERRRTASAAEPAEHKVAAQ